MDVTDLSESDKALLLGLKRGDENAFAQIYKMYNTKLYTIAFLSLKSEESAKEIVQEIFISLWINRQTVTVRLSLQSYLIGAVRHKVFNTVAKRDVRERYRKEFLRTAATGDNSTEQAVEFDELNKAIHEQIEALPETTRDIFVMSRYGGLNNNEIAQQFKLSSKAVEYHITKALKVLRTSLKHVINILILIAVPFV